MKRSYGRVATYLFLEMTKVLDCPAVAGCNSLTAQVSFSGDLSTRAFRPAGAWFFFFLVMLSET